MRCIHCRAGHCAALSREGDHGAGILEHRVARLAPLAGIAALVGCKRRTYPTRGDTWQDVFDHVEMIDNLKRKHTNNGMLSPADFEIRQLNLNQAGAWPTGGTALEMKSRGYQRTDNQQWQTINAWASFPAASR